MQDINKVKMSIMVDRKAPFFGALLCNIDIKYNDEIPTACTNGKLIELNTQFFKSLDPKSREGLVRHELGHIARLHSIRAENRDLEEWNIACDIVINNWLYQLGYSSLVAQGYYNTEYMDMSEEEIYEIIKSEGSPQSEPSVNNDIRPSNEDSRELINIVNTANVVSKSMGYTESGSSPIDKLLEEYFKPKLKWNVILEKYFNDISEDSYYSFRRPNRRYIHSMYLPSKQEEENKLGLVQFYLDTSGSIDDNQLKLFNTELRYIHDEYKPLKMELIQWNDRISSIKDVTDNWEPIKITSTGGTNISCVMERVKETKPQVAVIFSDLFFDKESTADVGIPIIWIAVNTTRGEKDVLTGKVIHINTND